MNITSDEINILIYNYLKERGLSHTAYCLEAEAQLLQIDNESIVCHKDALISLLQKGLRYLDIMTHLNTDGTLRDCKVPLSLSARHECSKTTPDNSFELDSRPESYFLDIDLENTADGRHGVVRVIEGHKGEVYFCTWNPVSNVLLTASADSSVCLWGFDGEKFVNRSSITYSGAETSANSNVTVINWNKSGTGFGTGDYGGRVGLWDAEGKQRDAYTVHTGPVFSLKWNEDESHLLTGSYDTTAAVWDTASKRIVRKYAFHTEPILDVEWIDKKTFATASCDKKIYICSVDSDKYYTELQGHAQEINCITWNSYGNVLASSGDDMTVRLWDVQKESPVHTFTDHQGEVFVIKWVPMNPNLLLSCSKDKNIILWDVQALKCVQVYAQHQEVVYTIDVSNDGNFLVSGSNDNTIKLWDIASGKMIRSYDVGSQVFELSYSRYDNKIAAGTAKAVCLIDVRF